MLGNFAHPCKILAHNFSSITSNFTDRSFKGTFTVWLKLGQIQMTVNSVLESVMLSIYFFFANFRSLGKANFKRLIKMVGASEHLGITPLTGKFVKTPKKSAIFDHMLLDGHKASSDNFLILLKENNAFKLQLKESLLISRDKPILNRNIYSFPLELFD